MHEPRHIKREALFSLVFECSDEAARFRGEPNRACAFIEGDATSVQTFEADGGAFGALDETEGGAAGRAGGPTVEIGKVAFA